MKKVALYFVATLVVVLGLVLVVPSFLNWNEYKAEVTNTLYAQTGHKVTIDGNLMLKLLPSPALSAGNIILETPTGQAFLSLDRLDVNVGFFALLSGRIEAKSIVLAGGQLNIERFADGTANWDFLIPKTSANSQENSIVLDHVSLDGLEVHYKDALLERDDIFSDIKARLSAQSMKGPFDIDASALYGGVAYGVHLTTGKIAPAVSFPISLNLTVADYTPGIEFSGTVVLDGAASAASGQINIGVGSLDELASGLILLANGADSGTTVFPINLDKSFEFSAPLVVTKARISASPFSIKAGEVTGEGSLVAKAKDKAGFDADFAIKLNQLKVENWLTAITNTKTTKATADSPNNLSVNWNVEVSALEYAGETVRRTSMAGTYAGDDLNITSGKLLLPGDTDFALSGKLAGLSKSPSFDGKIAVSSSNIKAVINWLKKDIGAEGFLKDIAKDRLKGFQFDGALKWKNNTTSLSAIKGQLDGTKFTGNLSANQNATPHYNIDIGLNNFDLDHYFKPTPKVKYADAKAAFDAYEKRANDNLAKLNGLHADIKLSADSLAVEETRFEKLNIKAKLDGNKLSLEQLNIGSFYGVKLGASGTVNGLGATPQYDLDVDISASNLATFTRWAEVELPVDVYKLDAVALKGHYTGSFREGSINLTGQAAKANFSMVGNVAGLAPTPQKMDIGLNVNGNDHLDFIARMELPLSLKGAAKPFKLNSNLKADNNIYRIDASLEAIGGRTLIVGDYENLDSPKFDVNIEASFESLNQVADAFDLGFDSKQNLGRMTLKAKIIGANKNYNINLTEGIFGPSRAVMSLNYNIEGKRPKIDGTISFDNLPLSRFYASSKTGANAAKSAGGQRWSREPFKLDTLRDYDAKIEFKAQEISYDNYRFQNPEAIVVLNAGQLAIDNFKGQLFAGRTTGRLALDVRGIPKGQLSLSIEEAKLEEALSASAAISPINGKLAFHSDLTFAGASQYDAISALNGTVEVWAKDGVIKGIDMDRISARMARLNRLPDFITLLGAGLSGGETPFGNIRTSFEGKDGIFSARQVSADIEGADVAGRMIVNLPAWTMTGTGSMTFNNVELPQAPKTREVVDANGVKTIEEIPVEPVRDVPPIGVDVSGDIDAPAINYRTDRLRNFMAERFASSLLNNIIGGSGGIGGLLGAKPAPSTTVPNSTAPSGDATPPTQDPKDVVVNELLNLLAPKPKKDDNN